MSGPEGMTIATRNDPRPYLPWCLGSFAASAVVIVLGNTNLRSGEHGGTGPMIVSLALCALAAAILYRLLVSGRRLGSGLALSMMALASMVVFWSGLPIVLGPAALVVGIQVPGRRNARIAVLLGGAVAVVAFVLGVVAGLT